MKRGSWNIAGLSIIWMLLSSSCYSTRMNDGPQGGITYQTFYDQLSPYGTWIDYPTYGHVWHPTLAGDFRPYLTNGYWDYSIDGWLWVSNYNWGWAPFHYGRWVYDNFYGWLWIPGYDWAPAWVTWGYYDDFYAWAPLTPEVYVGMSFGLWRPPSVYWNFCRRNRMYDRDINSVVEKRDFVIGHASTVDVYNNFGNTRRHNEFYAKGPELTEVQHYINRPISTVQIKEVNKLQQANRTGNELRIYRPSVRNPQPREFRRIDNGQTNPIRNDGDRSGNEREQQRKNVERLPVQHPPASRANRSGRRH